MSQPSGTAVAKKAEVTIKLDAEIYRQLKTAASWHDVGITEFLNDLLRPIAQREVDKVQAEMGQSKKKKE